MKFEPLLLASVIRLSTTALLIISFLKKFKISYIRIEQVSPVVKI